MTLSAQILTGLVLGISAGLFFGEPMGVLGVVGSAFVKLLQMTVMPYIIASLVAGLGRIDREVAGTLAVRGGLLLLLLWALAFCLVVMTPLSFPKLQSASFFSTTLLERSPAFDFVGLYIPSNPFHSMANNIVPAVVVFSIAVGVALMALPDKDRLIGPLDTLAQALHRVASFVLRLMPFGVFAIAASAAGTLELREAERIQVYVVGYVLSALAMCFLVLPGVVAALTPIPFREVANLGRGVLLTAFATGSEFVVLPLIGDRCKELLRRYAPGNAHAESLVDVIVPVTFSFPHVAKLLSMSFVPFAAWYSGTELSLWDYPKLGLSGVVTLFGSINLAMPFLLNLMRVPEDLFQLFLATGIINARFGTMLAAVHILCLTVLASCAIGGGFRPRWGRLLVYSAASLGFAGAMLLGSRLVYTHWIDTTYTKAEVLGQMQLMQDQVSATTYTDPPETPPIDLSGSRFDAIRERGRIRVCYDTIGNLPFSFLNARGELVGFDIDMAHSLAQGLGLELAFVPLTTGFDKRPFSRALATGYCDIGVGRNALTLTDASQLDYSIPYLDLTAAFVVLDHRRREFADLDEIISKAGLRLAIPDDRYFRGRFQRLFPLAEFVPVDGLDALVGSAAIHVDAMIFAAEMASAWTLIHPEFSVVVPDAATQRIPMAFLLPQGDSDWANTINTWVELKKRDGTIEQLYDHWVLGRAADQHRPRWSVIRDVLHWTD